MASGMKKPLEKSNIDGLVGWMNESPAIKSTLLKAAFDLFSPFSSSFFTFTGFNRDYSF